MKIDAHLWLYAVVMCILCRACTLCLCSSDRDGTDSSELTGVNHVISPIQVASTQRPENETLVAGPELPVIIPLGPHEEVGDTHLSVCVSKQICRRKYIKC